MKGSRLYVPSSLRVEMLSWLHEGHHGIVRTHARACQAIWWPGISREVEDMVKNCIVCVHEQRPLYSMPLPELPWQRVGSNLFELNGKHYLTVVDYFYRFIKMALLKKIDTDAVTASL